MLYRRIPRVKLGLAAAALLALLAGSFAFSGDTPPAHSQVSPAGPEDEAVAAAWGYLRRNAAALGLRADLADLRVGKVARSLTGDHVSFQQLVQGIPVYGGAVTVRVDKQRRVTPPVGNRYQKGAAVRSLTPGITADAAVAAGSGHLGVTNKLRRKATAALVVYPNRKDGSYALAWNVKLATDRPLGDWDLFVDATTGTVLGSYNRIRQDSYSPGRQ